MNLRKRELLGLGLTLAIVLAVILNGTLYFWRFDLTENRVYSISRVSRNLFREIPENISINYYLSDRLRTRALETQQIADVLYQYAAFSRGKIAVDVSDPSASNSTDTVESLGVTPRQIEVVEDDQVSLAVVYSGIVISYLDRFQTIPFIIDPSTLEYELTADIRSLVQDTERSLGVLIGDDGRSLNADYQLLNNQLNLTYEVRALEQGEPIAQDISALVVLGANSLDEFELFPIDQYIMSGGTVLFAVDGVVINLQFNIDALPADDVPIFDMLRSYGVGVRKELVLDTFSLDIPIRRQTGSPIVLQTLEPYPHWIQVQGSSVNREHPITARFAGFDLFWASPLDMIDPTGTRVSPLIESSDESWIMEAPFNADPNDAASFAFSSNERGRYVLGATIEGQFESYFDTIPTREGEESSLTTIIPSVDASRVVVIGDTEFATNLLQYSQNDYNVGLIENTIEWLSNDEDLIAIRTRATRDQRLNAIQDIQVRSRVASIATILNVAVVPLLVAVFGLMRFLSRRRRSQKRASGVVA